MWKREMSWPLTESPRLVDGQLLVQQPGQPAVLIQPESGETRQRLPSQHIGWTIPQDSKSWLQLTSGGQILSSNKDWTQWRSLGQLRLKRGEKWFGPPVLVGTSLYVGTTRGRMQQVQLQSTWKGNSVGTQLPRPLLPPVAHPLGVVEVSLNGLIGLRAGERSWTRLFPGWNQCYSGSGDILARPSVDPSGNIYLASRNELACWDSTGRLRWRRLLGCSSAALWREGGCYVADSSPAVLKLDPLTGETLSRYALPAGVASDPAVEKALLAVALNNGEVYVYPDMP